MLIDVAIVDDDLSVRKGVSRLLRSEGFATAGYASAEDFLASGDVAGAGCLIVDIHLGGMSGFELVDRLRQAGGAPEAIFITAHDEDATRDALTAAGSPECLRKPFDSETLLNWVRRALRDKG